MEISCLLGNCVFSINGIVALVRHGSNYIIRVKSRYSNMVGLWGYVHCDLWFVVGYYWINCQNNRR